MTYCEHDSTQKSLLIRILTIIEDSIKQQNTATTILHSQLKLPDSITIFYPNYTIIYKVN